MSVSTYVSFCVYICVIHNVMYKHVHSTPRRAHVYITQVQPIPRLCLYWCTSMSPVHLDAHIYIYMDTRLCLYGCTCMSPVHLDAHIYIYMDVHVCLHLYITQVQPIPLGVLHFRMLFQSSKRKARTSHFTETWQKRRSSFELSKMSPQVGLAVSDVVWCCLM